VEHWRTRVSSNEQQHDLANGTGWWSADHLFLDQDGIPTIVEVKRQTDARLRREVVEPMLDYAANAVAYLPPAFIRSRFEGTCAKKEKDPDQELQDRLGQDIDIKVLTADLRGCPSTAQNSEARNLSRPLCSLSVFAKSLRQKIKNVKS
jgi:hypothetical protein